MNVNELISLFRTEVADIEQPYLWTDDEVLTYLNDAYTMFVRFVGGVSDSSSAITTIAFAPAATSVPLDATVLRVVRAFRASDGAEVAVIENTDMPLVRVAGKLSLLKIGGTTGPVEYLIGGANRGTASLYPTPTVGDSLKLQVRRLPAAALTVGTGSPDDIGSEHHIHLLKWMKSMAYRKQDSETLDPGKAAENESLFLQYCSQSVYEQERLRRKSRVGLRTERDIKNPMLVAQGYRGAGYAAQTRSSRSQPNQQGESQ